MKFVEDKNYGMDGHIKLKPNTLYKLSPRRDEDLMNKMMKVKHKNSFFIFCFQKIDFQERSHNISWWGPIGGTGYLAHTPKGIIYIGQHYFLLNKENYKFLRVKTP